MSSKEKEVGDEYSSSLADLTMNSKPLINMLTILAEESIDHAAVIVQSVEKHLDKVRSDIKLPVLYLVDSIIKNVGGAYTQLFAQIIVNMFCKVFKQVDEKTRSQMFKLRETWHDVFPSTKLYQLDVKVNMIDPAWPIQARPPQTNIHVNPNFLNRAVSSGSTVAVGNSSSAVVPPGSTLTPEEIKMREAVARKEQELLRLQKIEMELAQKEKEVRKALEKRAASQQQILASVLPPEVISPAILPKPKPVATTITVQPVAPRIAPVNPALINTARRRDPRLVRLQSGAPQSTLTPPQEPPSATVATKRVDPRILRKPDIPPSSVSPVKHDKSPGKNSHRHSEKKKERTREHSDSVKSSRISKLQPIPKIKPIDRHAEKQNAQISPSSSPTKRKKEIESPRSSRKHKKSKDGLSKEDISEPKVQKKSSIEENKKIKQKKHEPELEKEETPMETFKEVKRQSKERNYIRRNREKSESPEGDIDLRTQQLQNPPTTTTTVPETVSNGASGDVDLRTLPSNIIPQTQRKRSTSDSEQHEPNKKSKTEKLDELFGNEDVDLRKLPVVEEKTRPVVKGIIPNDKIKSPPPVISKPKANNEKTSEAGDNSNEEDEETEGESSLGNIKDVEGGWAKVKEIQSPQVAPIQPPLSNLDAVRAKLAKATKKDGLGRLRIFSSTDDLREKKKSNSKDTDMRLKSKSHLEGNSLDNNIKIIMSQAEEQLQSGNINEAQYNVLLMQVLQLNERQKLKEAKQKESLEASKRKLHWLQQKKTDHKSGDEARERSTSPESERSTDSPVQSILNKNLSIFGDIDERVPPSVVLPTPSITTITEEANLKQKDSDMRMLNQISDKKRPEKNLIQPRPEMNMGHPQGPGIRMPQPVPDMNMGHPQGPGMRMPQPVPDMNMMIPMNDMSMPMMRPDMNMPRPDGMFPGGAPWSSGPRGFGPRGFRGPRPRNEEWGGPRGFRGRGPMSGNWRMPGGNRPMMDMPVPPNHPPFTSPEPQRGMFLGTNPIPPYIRDERSSPPPLGASPSKDYTRLSPEVLEYMQRDTMKSISIDGVNRDIRFYGATALIMLDWDDPREIFFQPGQRKVHVDDKVYTIGFGEDYTPFTVDGVVHRMKFGSPTRELIIDDRWYECFFGGPPVGVLLDGKVRIIKLDGPPPQVTIGDVKRTDLCAGKINMIVDAVTMVPVFLDAKPQLVEIGGVPHSLRFVDALETILINEKPYKIEFGGLPKPMTVNKKKYFVRFTVLPRTVKAGTVNILNMEGRKPNPVPVQPMMPTIPTTIASMEEKPSLGGLDILASILPSSAAPSPQVGSYSAVPVPTTKQETATVPTPLQNVDISNLFAQLVATGILQNPVVSKQEPKDTKDNYTTNNSNSVKVEEKKPEEPVVSKAAPVKLVDLKRSETLKVKQPGLVTILHLGMQCGSCGARFPPEHTTRYSQHLDWHFRQNRAEKDSQRRPHSRRWYYDISDWVQFEEIEDLEEREKSWFERQQEEGAAVEASEAIPSILEEVSVVAPPPFAPPHQFKCSHCGDPFHQFYNQELEEWQLRRAVTYENSNYHPDCLEEFKTSMSEKPAEESGIDLTDKVMSALKESNDWEDDDDEQQQTENNDDMKEEVTEEQNTTEEVQQEEDDEEESVVEVLSEKSQEDEEVELVDDDDVVIKTEPVVQITVEDADTDEETEMERAARDREYEIDFSKIKVKQEPIDPDDEPVITSEEIIITPADTTHAAVISSIDGNVQLQPAAVPTTTAPAIIRINITKPLVPTSSTPPPKPAENEEQQDQNATEEPPEVEPEYTLKQSLEGVSLTKYPPTVRGNELSGLCSIM